VVLHITPKTCLATIKGLGLIRFSRLSLLP
jgi:hypothetical protein